MSRLPSLAGRVAVVTGASRGIGKGIATLLGQLGATVYVTGRSTTGTPNATPGTINEVAEAITSEGGFGVAVTCANADDGQIKVLFERIKTVHRHLVILVNIATTITPNPMSTPSFWHYTLIIARPVFVGKCRHHSCISCGVWISIF